MKDETNKIVNWIEMGYTRLNYKEELSLVDYIKQLQKENKELKEVIDKAIEELKKGLHELDTRRREEVYVEEYIEESIDILKEVE